MEHGQVVEEDHVTGLELDLDGASLRKYMQCIKRLPLDPSQSRKGVRTWSGRSSGDASARAIYKDSARWLIRIC